MDKYILRDGAPVLVRDMLEWARWYESASQHVARDQIGDVTVSTVFLGLDHRHFGNGPPILFETMVFGGALDQEQVRYCSWDEAVRGHVEMMTRVFQANEKPRSSEDGGAG